jgi:large subunit ribosomal protein L32
MGLPKRRQSKARARKRRTHYKLSQPARSRCPHCNQPKLPHRVCPHCGYYGTKSKIGEESGGGRARKTVKPARRVLLVKES